MLNIFLQRVKSCQPVDFNETIAVIDRYYHYRPTAFSNGLNPVVHNPAGSNEGSCRIFAFARLHALTPEQTLALFGDYHAGVLANPDGHDHANIRQFMRDGWAGVVFAADPLQAKAGHDA
ncbi:MAG: HopJ type III effector protein [Methylomonas sp.]